MPAESAPALPPTAIPALAPHPALSERTLYLMSAACGISVANIYYNQPLLELLAKHFQASPAAAGWVATAAQVGYGLGLFLFVPLGDLVERRKLVLGLISARALLMVGAAVSPTMWLLALAQLLVGITATSAQILIPLGMDLTPNARRGHTVGVLMAGVLSGILLARTVAGFLAVHLGWQSVFWVGAALMAAVVLSLRAVLPHRPPTLRMSYPRLMHSLLEVSRTPGLFAPTVVSALSFGTFIAFWTALSFLMHDRFGKGAAEAGAFGIVGLAGALAAPLAGKLTDRRGAAFTLTCSLALSLIAFALMGVWVSITSLILGVLLMDLGVQCIQVAAQSKVIALIPAARSRLNTIYMCARFTAGATGSAASAYAYTHWGWTGVSILCAAVTALAAAIHLAANASPQRAAPSSLAAE